MSLNPATREARVDDPAVTLSAHECTVLSRTQLEEKLYGWKDDISSNAVEVYIHNLRKKLGNER